MIENLIVGVVNVVASGWVLYVAYSKTTPRYEISRIIKKSFGLGVWVYICFWLTLSLGVFKIGEYISYQL